MAWYDLLGTIQTGKIWVDTRRRSSEDSRAIAKNVKRRTWRYLHGRDIYTGEVLPVGDCDDIRIMRNAKKTHKGEVLERWKKRSERVKNGTEG